MLVCSLVAIDVDVVAKRRSSVVDSGLEYSFDRFGQGLAAVSSYPGCLGVDTGREECLVGVDVPNTGYRSLAEQLRLHHPFALRQGLVQVRTRERVGKRFWSHVVKGRYAAVLAGVDDVEPPEASNVSEDEMAAVIESPEGPNMGAKARGLGWFRAAIRDMKLTGHTQVSDEFSLVIEDEHQVLPSAPDGRNRRPCGIKTGRELGAPV